MNIYDISQMLFRNNAIELDDAVLLQYPMRRKNGSVEITENSVCKEDYSGNELMSFITTDGYVRITLKRLFSCVRLLIKIINIGRNGCRYCLDYRFSINSVTI